MDFNREGAPALEQAAANGAPQDGPTDGRSEAKLTSAAEVGSSSSEREPEYELVWAELDEIDDTGSNVRSGSAFDPEDEEDQGLVKSSVNGNYQPGMASRKPAGAEKPFRLVFGFRRLAALRELERMEAEEATKATKKPRKKRSMLLLVTNKQFTEEEVTELQLIENCQRKDMNPMDRVEAYARLRKKYSLKEVADKVKFSQNLVSQYLTIHKYLPDERKTEFREGALTFTEAYDEAKARKDKHKRNTNNEATSTENGGETSAAEVEPPKEEVSSLPAGGRVLDAFSMPDKRLGLYILVVTTKKKDPTVESVIEFAKRHFDFLEQHKKHQRNGKSEPEA